MNRVCVIVPAFNEAPRIGAVIQTALDSEIVDQIIVIDDGSSDDTAKVASKYEITLIKNGFNLGKGESLARGVTEAKKNDVRVVVFLDADLRNLKAIHLNKLVDPLLKEKSLMTIGILERTALQKLILLKHWGGLSGQRAMTMMVWDQLGKSSKKGFRIEAALNAVSRLNSWHRQIERVELQGVKHVGQRVKKGSLLRGIKSYIKVYGVAGLEYLRFEKKIVLSKLSELRQ